MCVSHICGIGFDIRKLPNKIMQKNNFLDFVKMMWPEFIEGYHHKIIAKKFEALAQGKIKRLIVNLPPRHTKSEFCVLSPSFLVDGP